MEEMQQHNMSWIEVQFLKKAVDILCECRRTLMYTYVFAYYLRKNNQSEIFEVCGEINSHQIRNHKRYNRISNILKICLRLFTYNFRKIKKTWKRQLKLYPNIWNETFQLKT